LKNKKQKENPEENNCLSHFEAKVSESPIKNYPKVEAGVV
jgi:hypothetical protein